MPAPVLPPANATPPRAPARPAFFSARRWHKGAGLCALAWLAVLGTTGFLMNHREDWNWIWQRGLPAAWFPADVVRTAAAGLARQLQIDPADDRRRIAAGVRGVWWSRDAGRTWTTATTATVRPLIVNALEPAPGWASLWFGTQDGVWLSRDGGRTLQPVALRGVRVTALALGSRPDELLGVAERSRVFRLDATLPARPAVTWLPLGPAAASTEAPGANLSRLTLDLHYGRGFFGAPWDGWINNLAGLGLLTLCGTGLLLWLLPWRWRQLRLRDAARPAVSTRKSLLVWLLGVHAKWLGPVLLLPLALLCLTGIYIGHYAALSPGFKATTVPATALPPTYAMRSWQDWIECIAADPDRPGCFSLGTRTGLFTTEDDGRTWRAETSVAGGVFHLRRIRGELLAPNGMGGIAQRSSSSGWKAVAPAGSHLAMASEVTAFGPEHLLWKHGTMLHISDAEGRELAGQSFKGPTADLIPFYTIAARLHAGTLFWKQWRWINDGFALAGMLLLGTGLVRWWRLIRAGRPAAPDRHLRFPLQH